MTIAFAEHAESRAVSLTVQGEGQRLRFVGSNSLDEAAVRAAFLALMPEAWNDLTFVGAELKPLGNSGWWDCVADYAYSAERAAGVRTLTIPGVDDPLGPEFEFDLTAQTAHITQSLRTVTSRYDLIDGGVNPPAAWANGASYVIGELVYNGGQVFTCVVGGKADGGGSGPSGTGSGIADGSVVWDYVPQFDVSGATVKIWTAATDYTAGERVDSHGYLYECTTAGTSAATGDGPEGAGGGIVDGTAAWVYVSPDHDPAAPDYGGAIGVSRDRVSGCDIYVGHLEFSVTAQYYPVTLSLIEILLDLVGTFNAEPWYNFPTKTLLYLGCTGSPRPGNIWTLKHRFACSKNVRSLKVGSRLTIPFKGGWDFLWCAYRDAVIQSAGGNRFNIQRPYAAYVEQVYRPGDFGTLPI